MSRSVGNVSTANSLVGGVAGQIPYQSAPDTTEYAGPGTAGQVLTSNGAGAPTFQTPSSSSNIPGGTAGQVVYQSAPSTTAFTGPGTSGQVLTSNGTAAPTYQNVSLATNASNLSSGTAGQIPYQTAPGLTGFAGPGTSGQYLTSNGTGAPTYTTLVTAPTANSIAAGAANQVLYQSASSTTAFAGPGTSGQILTANGSGVPTFQTLTVVPRATNISGGTVGQLPYQSAVDTTAFVGPGTSGQFLRSNGAAPPSFASVTAQPPTYTIYTSGTGTYIAPAGVQYLIVEMVGGGGGGGMYNNSSSTGGGGGAAAYLKLKVTTGNYSYTVGTGGVGGISGGAFPSGGTAGTATGFGLASSLGGGGGSAAAGANYGGAAGNYGTGGYTILAAVPGTSGGDGIDYNSNISTPGGSSFWGIGQPSVRAANTGVTTGTVGGYGTGGNGLNTNFPSAPSGCAGAPGRIVITEVY